MIQLPIRSDAIDIELAENLNVLLRCSSTPDVSELIVMANQTMADLFGVLLEICQEAIETGTNVTFSGNC